jgi:hypothetical protein
VNIMRNSFAACAIAIALFATTSSADPYDAYKATITDGTLGNGKGRQTMRDFSLGLDFEVLYDHITITRLGIWDDVYGDGLSSPHSLMIYDLANPGAPLVTINTLPGTGTLEGGYRYFDVPMTLTLTQGTQFSMVVYYPVGNMDSNGNSGPYPPMLGEPNPIFNDGMGLVSNIGVARYGAGLAFPGVLDTGPENRYHAGSFTYTPNPEPGTILLVSGALAAAGAWRRRRAKRAQAQA